MFRNITTLFLIVHLIRVDTSSTKMICQYNEIRFTFSSLFLSKLLFHLSIYILTQMGLLYLCQRLKSMSYRNQNENFCKSKAFHGLLFCVVVNAISTKSALRTCHRQNTVPLYNGYMLEI